MIITKKIPVGANVTWEASAEDYFPQHGSFIMPNSIKELNIDLEYNNWSDYWIISNSVRGNISIEDSSGRTANYLPLPVAEFSSAPWNIKVSNPDLEYIEYWNYPGLDAGTFQNCSNLRTVSNICHRSSETSYARIRFINCPNLTSVTNFDAKGVELVEFRDCPSLTTLDIVNMQRVEQVGGAHAGMFQNCSSLISVPAALSEAPLYFANYMFQNCSSLTTIPSLNTSNCSGFESMFENCFSLATIPPLDASHVYMSSEDSYNFNRCFSGFTGTFGGFTNLGKGLISSDSKIIVLQIGPESSASKWIGNLNAQSIINILNNLYDVSQISGRTTRIEIWGDVWNEIPEETIVSATAKGWTIQH